MGGGIEDILNRGAIGKSIEEFGVANEPNKIGCRG